jgi:peptidoglycan hydrolase CwlO-like protein
MHVFKLVKRTTAALAVGAALSLLPAASSAGDLASRHSAHQQRANELRNAVQNETQKIQGYEGTISALQARLAVVEHTVVVQEALLRRVRAQLSAARVRLGELQQQYARGRRVLADELRAEYESPPPTIVGVIVNANGFDDLLNRLNYLRTIERRNTRIVGIVRDQRVAVAAQARRLAVTQQRRERATAAVVAERDQIAQLKLSIVDRELVVARQRRRDASRLSALRQTLAKEAATLDAQAAAAQAAVSTGGAGIGPGGCASGGFVPHSGSYGFFPAAGTDYSAGEEPVLAARLDALGRALQLHLIGISCYRSPQHSVEVGGFADDPHTQGIASDTPGVEGVPEATLEHFCLTRPFGGAREADHIQPL